MCMDGALKMYRIKRDKQDSVLGRELVGFYHCATAAVVAAAVLLLLLLSVIQDGVSFYLARRCHNTHYRQLGLQLYCSGPGPIMSICQFPSPLPPTLFPSLQGVLSYQTTRLAEEAARA